MRKLLSRKHSSIIVNLISSILFIVITTFAVRSISRSATTTIITICINVVLTVSLNISSGSLGEIVLGQAGFMAIGAYVTGLFCIYSPMDSMVMQYIICIVLSAISAGIVGLIVGIPCLRLRGDYLAIVTLGFGEAIRCLLQNLTITNGAMGLNGLPNFLSASNGYSGIFVALVTVVLVVAIVFSFMTSRHGRAILSIREDSLAAAASGIPVVRYKIIAFTISAMFAGIGGCMYANTIGSIYPSNFNLTKSVDYLVMVVFGGLGSYTGSVVSAVALSFLSIKLTNLAAWRMVIYSLALILIMIFHPKGLFGIKEFSLTNSILNYKENWVKFKLALKNFFTSIPEKIKKQAQKLKKIFRRREAQ